MPTFAHNCLGICERVHKTLAERLTPYVNSHSIIGSSITFSIN